jgi:hypothetical protein
VGPVARGAKPAFLLPPQFFLLTTESVLRALLLKLPEGILYIYVIKYFQNLQYDCQHDKFKSEECFIPILEEIN